MPATRSVIRQGSRQPAPYPPDNAGPSHVPLFLDDGTPPRKKQAAERKSSKQRSKQKARAPLLPSSEIIEISSDEDEPPAKKRPTSLNVLEKRVKELEEENTRLQTAAAQALLKEPPLVQRVPTPTPNAEFSKFLSIVEDHASCEVCTLKMWQPYTLACGHTFCRTCLQDWFSTALAQHLATYPNYDAQKLVPAQFRASLARHDLPPHTRRNLEREIALVLSGTPHPQYSCPTCRVLIRAKPAENFVVKHLVRTIAGVQGESQPKENAIPRIPGRPVEGPFDGFFPDVGYTV